MLPACPADVTDAEAIAAIADQPTATSALARLFAQIQRLLGIDRLHTITPDVVAAAAARRS